MLTFYHGDYYESMGPQYANDQALNGKKHLFYIFNLNRRIVEDMNNMPLADVFYQEIKWQRWDNGLFGGPALSTSDWVFVPFPKTTHKTSANELLLSVSVNTYQYKVDSFTPFNVKLI